MYKVFLLNILMLSIVGQQGQAILLKKPYQKIKNQRKEKIDHIFRLWVISKELILSLQMAIFPI
jgi:hypothetical protein